MPEENLKKIKKDSSNVLNEIKKILNDQKVGEIIRERFKIAIVGPANAGKSSILNNLSQNSLILLDEIGRGTSTYDGVSIAWAIAEYLHEHPTKAKTLFATHYHELNDMTKDFSRIKNFNVSVKESGKKILFIRKLKEGGSQHSFGIHVAKMAGIPNLIVDKANKILKQLEALREKKEPSKFNNKANEPQLSFFKLEDPIL